MKMKYLLSLYKESPEEAVNETIAQFGKRIVRNNEDYKYLCIYNQNVLRDKIVKYFEENNNNIAEVNDDEFVESIRDSISKEASVLLKRYYLTTGSDISFKEYVGYSRLVLGKTKSELVDYEERSFTYSVSDGVRKIKDVRGRIFDSLSDMYYVFVEGLSSGEVSVETFSFMVDKMNEITALIRDNDIETALEKTVALQLYLGFGTKFLPTLERFLTGELLISTSLGMIDGYNKGIDNKGKER